MKPETLLRLYPRAWRERYGEEFLDACGAGPLTMQQVIDIVGGAIDARFEPQTHVRQHQPEGVTMSAILHKLHHAPKANYTTTDALKAAAFIVVTSFVLVMAASACQRNGLAAIGHFLRAFASPAALVLSSHFTFLKGQSRTTKAVITGGSLVAIALICGWSALLATR